MTQLEYKSTGQGVSQCDKILARLQAANGEWVSMLDLWICSGSMAIHSRISDLRKRGHTIEQSNRNNHGRKVHSFYKLVT